MSGKRLLDLAALFNASRGVAQKHVALRARQLDAYNKTSTLAAAVRTQTERITETAKAASFLASRLNENTPEWAREAREEVVNQSLDVDPIPSKESVEEKGQSADLQDGLEQDHFYEKSAENSTVDDLPTGELGVQQKTAGRSPLPDGSILPKKSSINIPKVDEDVFSIKPRNEPAKEPLDKRGFQPASSSKSTIPTPSTKPLSSIAAKIIQRQSEQQIPSKSADSLSDAAPDPLGEGHDKDMFYRKSGHTSPVLSSLPRVKIPKHVSDIQEGDAHLPEGQINSESYYNAAGPSEPTNIPEQEPLPEDIDTDVFFSPRVARNLGGRTHSQDKYADSNNSVESSAMDLSEAGKVKVNNLPLPKGGISG